MKLTDDDCSELLEQLFPSESTTPVRAEDVFRWIDSDRKAKQRRLRHVATAAVVLVLGVCGLAIYSKDRAPEIASARTAPLVTGPVVPIVPPEPAQSVVQQIDDEALLKLLDDTPAALVEWPDGRRSLLVVVRQPEQ